MLHGFATWPFSATKRIPLGQFSLRSPWSKRVSTGFASPHKGTRRTETRCRTWRKRPCGVPVLRHACLATRPSCECLTSGGSSYILRPPIPPLTPSSSIEWRFFVHSGGNTSKRMTVFRAFLDEWRFLKRLFAENGPGMHVLPPLDQKCSIYRHRLRRVSWQRENR